MKRNSVIMLLLHSPAFFFILIDAPFFSPGYKKFIIESLSYFFYKFHNETDVIQILFLSSCVIKLLTENRNKDLWK